MRSWWCLMTALVFLLNAQLYAEDAGDDPVTDDELIIQSENRSLVLESLGSSSKTADDEQSEAAEPETKEENAFTAAAEENPDDTAAKQFEEVMTEPGTEDSEGPDSKDEDSATEDAAKDEDRGPEAATDTENETTTATTDEAPTDTQADTENSNALEAAAGAEESDAASDMLPAEKNPAGVTAETAAPANETVPAPLVPTANEDGDIIAEEEPQDLPASNPTPVAPLTGDTTMGAAEKEGTLSDEAARNPETLYDKESAAATTSDQDHARFMPETATVHTATAAVEKNDTIDDNDAHSLTASNPPPPDEDDDDGNDDDGDEEAEEEETAFTAGEAITIEEAERRRQAGNKLEAMERDFAEDGEAAAEYQSRKRTLSWLESQNEIFLSLLAGVQTDDFEYTVSQGSNREKTSWDGVQSMLIGVRIETLLRDNMHAHADYMMSMTHDGDASNSLNNPPTRISGSSDGSYERYSLGIDYRFEPIDHVKLSPRIGFFESRQEYEFNNRNVTGASLSDPNDHLRSRFDTIWNAMYVGGSVHYEASPRFTWYAMLDISLLDYETVGQLNLRPTLKKNSFKQEGDGIGVDVTLGVNWRARRQLYVDGFIRFAEWSVDGSVEHYPVSGNVVRGDLDDASFSSMLIGAGVSYAF